MAFLKKYIPILLSLIILTGCYADFEPDIDSTPVICINADAKPGEVLKIFATRTWRWSEGVEDESLGYQLKDGIVSLYVNDNLYETIEYSEWEYHDPLYAWNNKQCGFLSTYEPKPGDKIRIVAHSETYGDAEGEVTVPQPVAIDDVAFLVNNAEIESSGDKLIYKGNVSLEISFTDPTDEKNYYLFEGVCRRYHVDDSDGYFASYTNMWVNYDAEPLFTEHVSSLESAISETSGYTIFSDRMIAGKTYPLHIRLVNISYPISADNNFDSNKSYVEFVLSTISESYYKHVISVWESNDGINGILGGVGLADPVWECSNVSTGAGVISASAPSKIQIPISEFFKDMKVSE